MLDKKLEEILSKQIYAHKGGGKLFFGLDPTIAQIKQAFADEIIQPLGQGVYCSGAEWLDRFTKELESFIDTNRRTQDFTDAVLAARKASGVSK